MDSSTAEFSLAESSLSYLPLLSILYEFIFIRLSAYLILFYFPELKKYSMLSLILDDAILLISSIWVPMFS